MTISVVARRARRMRRIAGAPATALLLGWALPAVAQTTATTDPQTSAQSSGTVSPSGDQGVADSQAPSSAGDAGDEIVVTGVRASLASAQARKRNADQIVDSIVAEDIGKLPDRNVAEALQRISGIQIQRNYGEGSTVAIRGLTQVRTEVNGRDSFTANGGNSLSFEDVPSELLAGVDVYKNPDARMIEDQIGGLINLRTRKPFDFNGFKVSGSAGGTYFDLEEKFKPQANLLVSDRWQTGIGEIGLLADVSYQRRSFRQDTISTEPFYVLNPTSATDAATLAALGRTGQTTTLPHGTGTGLVPGNRRRLGIDVALQWRPAPDLELTGEVFRTDYKFDFHDQSFFAYSGSGAINPLPGAPFTFAPNGDFQSGTFQNVSGASNSSLSTRHSVTTDYSLNVKYTPTSNITVTGDLQYVRGKTDNLRSIVALTFTTPTLFQDIRGAVPIINLPTGFASNPANYTLGYYLDHIDRSVGTDKSARLDGEYKFDGDGLLKSFDVGARYSKRKNSTQDAGYRFVGLFRPFDNADQYQTFDFGDFFRGNANLYGNPISFPDATTRNYDATLAALGITDKVAYVPSSLNEESQQTLASYAVLHFGADAGSVPIDGNVGIRLVRTKVDASGFYEQRSVVLNADGTSGQAAPVYTPIDFSREYTSALPSLNIRAKLTDTLQARFAASKAIARPTFTQLNPSLSIGEPDYRQPIGTLTASGGNPELKQLKANQLDASLEWYYSKSSSLTGALFYKRVKDFIQTAVTNRAVTFPDGRTYTYEVASYQNGDKGTIKGFEVAYNGFFDFLPGLLSGLGAQANFTYVDSKAPPPSAATGSASADPSVPLEQLSKYSYNLVGIYEKGPLSARVAYNWRSKYVVTTAGNGTGNLPIYNKAFGQVDASVTYNFTDHVALSIDGTNLTDTRRATYFGIDSRPRDVTLNDRQISATARFTF